MEDEGASTPAESDLVSSVRGDGGVEYDVAGADGEMIMRTNRQIIDDNKSQIMTMGEIEAMKAEGISGSAMVAKIMESHSGMDQKTAFALAKYSVRKRKKYMKRFTVLPLDVATLARWIYHDKEAAKIMNLREEILALIGSWSHVHHTPIDLTATVSGATGKAPTGKYLVVDETGGLLVAYLAEKMGILYESDGRDAPDAACEDQPNLKDTSPSPRAPAVDVMPNGSSKHPHRCHGEAPANSIYLLHAASQPNLALMKYFQFDVFNPAASHPLTTHLKHLSWLQLLSPSDDAGYTEPEVVPYQTLQTWKGGRRSTHYRKRRRWERIKSTVDDTKAGDFDGLIVASVMQSADILRHLVPLLRGGAQVVVYTPTIEPLAELADLYSKERRLAFVSDPPLPEDMPTQDFPVDPSLLLAPTIQTARAKPWQVLPGRTHPLMTGKGGSEGYIFTATRVVPAHGRIEARGQFKRRKLLEKSEAGLESKQQSPVVNV